MATERARTQRLGAGRRRERWSRWQALAHAIAAVRSTDPATVESALKDLAGRRRWLAPLVYAAGTVAAVFDGVVLLLLRNWRLTLLSALSRGWRAVWRAGLHSSAVMLEFRSCDSITLAHDVWA